MQQWRPAALALTVEEPQGGLFHLTSDIPGADTPGAAHLPSSAGRAGGDAREMKVEDDEEAIAASRARVGSLAAEAAAAEIAAAEEASGIAGIHDSAYGGAEDLPATLRAHIALVGDLTALLTDGASAQGGPLLPFHQRVRLQKYVCPACRLDYA